MMQQIPVPLPTTDLPVFLRNAALRRNAARAASLESATRWDIFTTHGILACLARRRSLFSKPLGPHSDSLIVSFAISGALHARALVLALSSPQSLA